MQREYQMIHIQIDTLRYIVTRYIYHCIHLLEYPLARKVERGEIISTTLIHQATRTYQESCLSNIYMGLYSSSSSSIWRNVLRGHAGLYKLARLSSLPRSWIFYPHMDPHHYGRTVYSRLELKTGMGLRSYGF